MQWRKIFFCTGCFSLLTVCSLAQAFSWQLVDHAGEKVLKLEGEDQTFATKPDGLEIFVGMQQQWPGEKMAAILGKTIEDGAALLFQPSFPFRESLTYTAFWNQQNAFTFTIPSSTDRTELSAIYPSNTSLPANLLKLYLHFSAPMGEGRAYEHLNLVSASGDTVYQPFVPLQPELWSEDRTRLTLWLDPGRVKRGLLSHETHGVVIEPDQEYSLIVDAEWKDASGKSLGKSYRKDFRVGTPDYQKPRPGNWEYQFPYAGTTEPLSINFHEPLDQALASRMLVVLLDPGTAIAGAVSLEKHESQWYFYPQEPWQEGTYTIRVDSNLEDLAGNNLNRPFDREIFEGERMEVSQDFFTIHFKIKTSK